MGKNIEIKNEVKSSNATIHSSTPRFYFTRFYENTEFSGWEIGIFGFAFKWQKYIGFKKFTYWRGNNFGKIAMCNRSIEFTLPRLHDVV